MNDELDELLDGGSVAVAVTAPPEEPEHYPTFKIWKDAGVALEAQHGDYRWRVGDWLVAGEKQFGKKAYKEAAAITGYKKATLYDLARVASRVPTSVRTEDLSWNHHRAVENLKPEAQTDWLRQARAINLSVVALRRAIKRRRLPGHPPEPLTGDQDSRVRIHYLKVELSEPDIKVLNKLAQGRNVTPGGLLREIVTQYLHQPETVAEIENLEILATSTAAKNRRAARERWEHKTITSINTLLETYNDQPGSTMVDPGEFVAEWERINNHKFPFHLAMKRTEFKAHYGDISIEDARCGEFSQFEKREDQDEELDIS